MILTSLYRGYTRTHDTLRSNPLQKNNFRGSSGAHGTIARHSMSLLTGSLQPSPLTRTSTANILVYGYRSLSFISTRVNAIESGQPRNQYDKIIVSLFLFVFRFIFILRVLTPISRISSEICSKYYRGEIPSTSYFTWALSIVLHYTRCIDRLQIV